MQPYNKKVGNSELYPAPSNFIWAFVVRNRRLRFVVFFFKLIPQASTIMHLFHCSQMLKFKMMMIDFKQIVKKPDEVSNSKANNFKIIEAIF